MTRRIILSGVALALLATGPVMAADMPTKAPQAPTPYDWTGLYFGGHIGGAWDNLDWFEDATGGASGIGPTGFHDGSVNSSGVIGGGQVGYNYQSGWAVWGIQGDASAASIKDSNSCFPQVLGTVQSCTTRVDSLATVTGRVGAAFDRILLYVTGGGAFDNERLDDACNNCGLAGLPSTARFSGNRAGWTVGAGVEYALDKNWSVFAQYNFMGFGTDDLTFKGLPPNLPKTTPFTENIREDVNVVKVGFNYRFNLTAASSK